jgi:hypothetical protein
LCIDETGDVKKGSTTDYAAKQYIGNLGKTANGIVSVNAYAVVDGITYPLLFKIYKPKSRLKAGDEYHRTDISEVVKLLEKQPEKWKSGDLSWVLTVKPDNQPIGTIACWLEGHMAGFGYLLHQQYWRQGYATEAARMVVEWAISLPSIYRV